MAQCSNTKSNIENNYNKLSAAYFDAAKSLWQKYFRTWESLSVQILLCENCGTISEADYVTGYDLTKWRLRVLVHCLAASTALSLRNMSLTNLQKSGTFGFYILRVCGYKLGLDAWKCEKP